MEPPSTSETGPEALVIQLTHLLHRVHVPAGEMVGDMAFVTGEPRSATLGAAQGAECLVLRKEWGSDRPACA